MKKDSKDGFSILGLGAAACVACCAGPILAFLGGLGIVGLASTVLIGASGLLITVVAIAAFTNRSPPPHHLRHFRRGPRPRRPLDPGTQAMKASPYIPTHMEVS